MVELEGCSSVQQVVSRGIWRLAGLTNYEPAPVLDVIWSESLAHLDPARLAALFHKLEATFVPTMACPFPMPSHILQLLRDEQTVERQRTAEQAWQTTLAEIKAKFHPQLGWRGERLPDPILAAVRIAGGVSHLWQADDARLVWAKKEFIEAFLRDLA